MNRSVRHDLTVEHLIKSAELLFSTNGVSGTSMHDVADAVGLTRSSIYHYVSSKDELLDCLVLGYTSDVVEELQALTTDSSRTAKSRLRDAVVLVATLAGERPQRFQVLLSGMDSFPELIATQCRSALRAAHTALSALLAQGIEEGSIKVIDPEVGAHLLLGAAHWAAVWTALSTPETKKSPPAVAESLADIALIGLIEPGAPTTERGSVMHRAVAAMRDDLSLIEHLFISGGHLSADNNQHPRG